MNNAHYTIEQAEFLHYTQEKLGKIYDTHPVPAHSYDHVARVARWAREIATGEKARSVFLCELAGWLHDIGHTRMQSGELGERNHHELSYETLKELFYDDIRFVILTEAEKRELLYAVRYHWNNFADDYDTAWILRDADKLDLFGDIGVRRSLEFRGSDSKKLNLDMRLKYDSYYWIRTKTARTIVENEKLMKPVDEFYAEMLREKVEVITLT